ncbi:hypothetical protein ASG01_08845 [Chryseobacterium sp. Leaf180]|uniref:hypothetical protein n=1 Tax=Chryseobacterium sp. Leaf180 TaxID=1736289 RepID=UPI0007019325|nr:hypothetical protein [Chryseobacterium sp. Leaf180]KQR93294.1 hypothetical protein ASG01_08845 [Chryseobacterium sp. Leaf180]
MNNLKIYRDHKELPIWNYKRILQTGNFFYMISDYDGHEQIELPEDVSLEELFAEIQSNMSVDINEKNEDMIKHSHIERCKIQISLYASLISVIQTKQKQKTLCDQLNIDFNNDDLNSLLSEIRMPKGDDLEKQKEIILEKIQKLENDMQSSLQNMEKEDPESEDFDIDEQIINVKIGLEIDFDEKTTSLHQYQLYIKALLNKIEQINKLNKNG